MLRIKPDRSLQKGFNIMELMVTVAVGSVLLGVGIPAFKDFMDNNRMSAAANEINISLHLARTEAVKRRANISMCPSNNWDAAAPICNVFGNFRNGWIVFIDSVPPVNANVATEGADSVVYAHGPLPEGIKLTLADANNPIGGISFVSFEPDGFPAPQLFGNNAAFNFQLCDHRGDADTGGGIAAGRWIQLTPTGRPQIHRTRAEVEAGVNPTNGCS